MSEMSENLRARAKDKLTRLMSKSPGKVDASGWTENSDQKGNVQTGMRVLSRRAYRAGGLVASGVAAAPRADRKPRAKGGGVIDDLVNVEMKKANGLRDGEKHIGGLKAGGRAKKAGGGPTDDDDALSGIHAGGISKPLRDAYGAKPMQSVDNPRYNKVAVDKAIQSSNRSGRKISSGEAARIHRLLKGNYAAGGKATAHKAGCSCAKCSGDKVGKARGGNLSVEDADTGRQSLRLLKTHTGPNGHVAKVYRTQGTGEHRVKFFKPGGEYQPKADYYTDDKDDAMGTAKSQAERGFKSGGKVARASGGRTKKGAMNVNIIIAQTPKPALAAPQGAPPPPNAGPLGLHQGAPPPPVAGPPPMQPQAGPMMRKAGGRTYPIKTGGGGGKARLAKIAAYG